MSMKILKKSICFKLALIVYLSFMIFFINITLFAKADNINENDYYKSYVPVIYENSIVPFALGNRVYFKIGTSGIEREVKTECGSSVIVYDIDKDISDSQISKLNSIADNKFTTATRLSSATGKYNCHSYAWYKQSTENTFWMNDPSAYYNDGSYFETAIPHINDKICYFDSNDFNLHSGIVTEVISGSSNGVCGNSNLVTVVSKWGTYGLYKHRGDDCPYTSKYSGTAIRVKYYHSHNYNYFYENIDANTHKAYCSCYEYKIEQHDYTDSYEINLTNGHIAKCACGESKEETHSYTHKNVKIDNDETYHKAYCVCGDFIKAQHIWTTYFPPNLLSIINQYDDDLCEPHISIGKTYVRCKECDFTCEKKGFVPVIKG